MMKARGSEGATSRAGETERARRVGRGEDVGARGAYVGDSDNPSKRAKDGEVGGYRGEYCGDVGDRATWTILASL
jgi:hypothetical protein